MIVYELTNSEDHPVYQDLEISNGNRQYDFLRSMVGASLKMERPFLSIQIIKALNFQAIICLHISAGEFRPHNVVVGEYEPPAFFKVPPLMDDFVNMVNITWSSADPLALAAFVLWRLNWIHPFVNGNGRTARAASYFVLCTKLGGWLKGNTILPELIRKNREEYYLAIKAADQSSASGQLDLSVLHNFLSRLLKEQLGDVSENGANGSPS